MTRYTISYPQAQRLKALGVKWNDDKIVTPEKMGRINKQYDFNEYPYPTDKDILKWMQVCIMDMHPQPEDGKLVWVIQLIDAREVVDEDFTECLIKAAEALREFKDVSYIEKMFFKGE